MIKTIIQSIKLYLHRKDKFYGLTVSDIGFVPKNKDLYNLALIHKSASYKAPDGKLMNYERLEFLGDAILGTIVAELLYKSFPRKDEGFLTRMRAQVVSRESLNKLAIKIGLDKEVIAKSDISQNKHVYGDVFEAFVGAVYLDQGYRVTKRFIEKFIFPNFIDIQDLVSIDRNYKSRLIEWGQKSKVSVTFEVKENTKSLKERFVCNIFIEDNIKGSGVGATKKQAEQSAAECVVETLWEESEGNIIL
ncbi:MAG: ribonuclease III [Odoribacter sp.]|nr:ribonuclease III [Odoribacter sp.]